MLGFRRWSLDIFQFLQRHDALGQSFNPYPSLPRIPGSAAILAAESRQDGRFMFDETRILFAFSGSHG